MSTNYMMHSLRHPCLTALLGLCVASEVNAAGTRANEFVWSQMSPKERVGLLSKFPDLEVVPVVAVGTIQAAQVVNRSTAATYAGAELGSTLGQASYIDHAFKGTGSSYSAVAQVGAAVLGAAIGSALDTPGKIRFVLSYGVRTADGQVREVRVESTDEITKPLGACVYLADLTEAAPSLCVADKSQFLAQLWAASEARVDDTGAGRDPRTRSVACHVPSAGVMTLSLASCEELHGKVEQK
jgi:hypothetical protein